MKQKENTDHQLNQGTILLCYCCSQQLSGCGTIVCFSGMQVLCIVLCISTFCNRHGLGYIHITYHVCIRSVIVLQAFAYLSMEWKDSPPNTIKYIFKVLTLFDTVVSSVSYLYICLPNCKKVGNLILFYINIHIRPSKKETTKKSL